MRHLPALVAVFLYLSFLTVGGGMAAFPEMKTLTVDVHHWLTFPQLIHFYSVGQLAPGPNMMMVAAIGEWVAGPVGALAVVIAFFLPTTLLALGVSRIWARLDHWPWRQAVQRGLAPVSIGLLLAGSISIARGAVHGPLNGAIAFVVFALLMATRINPALLILYAAFVGLIRFASG